MEVAILRRGQELEIISDERVDVFVKEIEAEAEAQAEKK